MHCGIVLDISSHTDDILPPHFSLQSIHFTCRQERWVTHRKQQRAPEGWDRNETTTACRVAVMREESFKLRVASGLQRSASVLKPCLSSRNHNQMIITSLQYVVFNIHNMTYLYIFVLVYFNVHSFPTTLVRNCIYTLNILEFFTQISFVISRIWTNCNCLVIPVSCILYL